MEPYPGYARSTFSSTPPGPPYGQPPIPQPHFPHPANRHMYPQNDYPGGSYQPSALPTPGSYPYPPAGNLQQSRTHAPPVFPTQYHPQSRRAASQPPFHEPLRAYPTGGSQQHYPVAAAQQGISTGPPPNVQYSSASQPHFPSYHYHNPPTPPHRQSSPPYANVPYSPSHPAAVPSYPINAYERQDFRSSQPPMNYAVHQPSQPPFNQLAHSSENQSPPPGMPPQTQPNLNFRQSLGHTSSRLTQTQSFTSVDGWHAYDPTAEASKSQKKSAKKSTSSKTTQDKGSSKRKQVRISEDAPESVTSRRATVAPPPSAATNPNPILARAPSPPPPDLDATQSSATSQSAQVPAPEPTTPPAYRRLPRRGNLPPPNGQIPLAFTSEKQKLEYWQALTEHDQQGLSDVCEGGKSRLATVSLPPASGNPSQRHASRGASAAPERQRKGKEKEKEKEKAKGKEKETKETETGMEMGTEKAKGKRKEKATSKSTNATDPTSYRATTYKAATVEDAQEESDGGVSYASDRPLHASNAPVDGTATRSRRTPPPFPVPSEGYYGSNHMSVKVLDAFHQTQERLELLEHKMSNVLREYHPSIRPPRGVQSSRRHARPELRRASSGSRTSGRRALADSDGEDDESADDDDDENARVGDDEDEDDEEEDDDNDGDDDDYGDNQHAELNVQAQPRKTDPIWNRLTEIVRKYTDLKLLKFNETSELPALFPKLTDKELSDYRANKCPPFSEENFRICFVRRWIRCAWNFGAREFLVSSLIDICNRKAFTGVLEGPPLPHRYFTRKVMEQAVDSHVEYLRGRYKEHASPSTPAKEAKAEKRKTNNAMNRRKQTTLNARKRTANRNDLPRHAALLAKLDPCHMSGDEAATQGDDAGTSNQAFHIVEAAWQSEEFKICMRTLDVWNARDSGPRSGSRPRRRVALKEPRVVDSPAPVGLWRNCYDQGWLRNLDGPRRRQLKIVEEDFDFALPKRKEDDEDEACEGEGR